MGSGSKYEALTNAMKDKVSILSNGIDDEVEKENLKSQIASIEAELLLEIEEIRNTPIDAELVKKQASADFENKKKTNARNTQVELNDLQNEIKVAEEVLRKNTQQLDSLKLQVQIESEKIKQDEQTENLKAEQEYQKILSSVGNSDKTIDLKINKAKCESQKRKEQLSTKLSKLEATTKAQQDKINCVDKLYNDLKEISLKLGDKSC